MSRSHSAPTDRQGLNRLYISEVLSGLGEGCFWVALVVVLAQSPDYEYLIAGAVVARLAPRALLGVWGGRLVDRSDLRYVLVASSLMRAVVMTIIGVLAASDVSPTVMIGLVGVTYLCAVPARPAQASALPHIAGESRLAAAAARLSTTTQIMAFIGPMFGAVVVTVSTNVGFTANVLSFVASAAVLSSISSIPRRSGPITSGLPADDDQNDGPGVGLSRPLIAMVGAMYTVRGAEIVLYVAVVAELLQRDPAEIGYLNGAIGLGAVVGLPLAQLAGGRDGVSLSIGAAVVATAAPIALLSELDSTVASAAVLVSVGVAMVVFEVVVVVSLQRVTVPSRLGKMFGVVNSASNCGKLVGALLAPLLLDLMGLRNALLAFAVGLLVASALIFVPLTAVSKASAARRRELAPTVDALRTLGLFDGAPQVALERVAASLSTERCGDDTELISQGDPADDLFIGQAGTFVVRRDQCKVTELGAGDWFGEVGLINQAPRNATVVALAGAEVWRVPGRRFLAAVSESSQRSRALEAALESRR